MKIKINKINTSHEFFPEKRSDGSIEKNIRNESFSGERDDFSN